MVKKINKSNTLALYKGFGSTRVLGHLILRSRLSSSHTHLSLLPDIVLLLSEHMLGPPG